MIYHTSLFSELLGVSSSNASSVDCSPFSFPPGIQCIWQFNVCPQLLNALFCFYFLHFCVCGDSRGPSSSSLAITQLCRIYWWAQQLSLCSSHHGLHLQHFHLPLSYTFSLCQFPFGVFEYSTFSLRSLWHQSIILKFSLMVLSSVIAKSSLGCSVSREWVLLSFTASFKFWYFWIDGTFVQMKVNTIYKKRHIEVSCPSLSHLLPPCSLDVNIFFSILFFYCLFMYYNLTCVLVLFSHFII